MRAHPRWSIACLTAAEACSAAAAPRAALSSNTFAITISVLSRGDQTCSNFADSFLISQTLRDDFRQAIPKLSNCVRYEATEARHSWSAKQSHPPLIALGQRMIVAPKPLQ